MKKIIALLSLVVSLQVLADIEPGKFLLWQNYSDGEADSSCKRGINIILDQGFLTGRFALIYEVTSKEYQAVPAPERIYQLNKIEDLGCDIKSYSGVRQTAFGKTNLIVIDYRKNSCKKIPEENQIVVFEKNGRNDVVRYSLDF